MISTLTTPFCAFVAICPGRSPAASPDLAVSCRFSAAEVEPPAELPHVWASAELTINTHNKIACCHPTKAIQLFKYVRVNKDLFFMIYPQIIMLSLASRQMSVKIFQDSLHPHKLSGARGKRIPIQQMEFQTINSSKAAMTKRQRSTDNLPYKN